MKSESAVAVASIIISMVSITMGASLAKKLFQVLTPEAITFLRLSVSAVILFFVFKVWKIKLSRGNISSLVAYGVSIAFMYMFFYLSIKTLSVGLALAIELLGPLSVALYFSKNRFDFIWVLMASVGIYLIVIYKSEGNYQIDLLGAFYALIAAFFWGSYIIIGKKSGTHYGVTTPCLGLIIASLVTLPFGVYDIFKINIDIVNFELILMIIAVCISSSLIPLMLEMKALRVLSTKKFGILSSGEPAIGSVLGFFILNEVLSHVQIIGILLIVSASAGVVIFKPKDRKNS